MKQILKKITYQFYPVNIDAIASRDIYIKTGEYLKLAKIIMEEEEYTNPLLNFLLSRYKFVKDLTSKSMQDRSLNLQVFFYKNNKCDILVINISRLAPFYTIYILEVENEDFGSSSLWKNAPKRNRFKEKGIYKNEINTISDFLEEELELTKFNESCLNLIIPNINFQDIELGKFTFFNAFFINQYTTTIG